MGISPAIGSMDSSVLPTDEEGNPIFTEIMKAQSLVADGEDSDEDELVLRDPRRVFTMGYGTEQQGDSTLR